MEAPVAPITPIPVPPVPGDMAPEVNLPDDTGTMRNLSDQRGKWTVLYFYPKDDTPGCATEACEFRDLNSDINQRNAEVWGVSVLGSGSKAAFKAKFGLPFTLLADEDHATAERYGAWVQKENYGRKYMGIQRSSYLIDPDGRIAFAWPRAKSSGHAAEVLATLDSVQAARTK